MTTIKHDAGPELEKVKERAAEAGWKIAVMDAWQTTRHKVYVFWYMLWACGALLKRAVVHDLSKYGERERPYFVANYETFVKITYGTPEYTEALMAIQPALDHHYYANQHHPQHYSVGGGGIELMTPLDLIEMLCDWKAAGKTAGDGSGTMAKSLQINKDRFEINPALFVQLTEDSKEIGLL